MRDRLLMMRPLSMRRPLSIRWPLLVVASLALGCGDDPPPRTKRSDVEAQTFGDKPVTRQAIASVKKATAAATRLSKSITAGKPKRGEYLAMRRAIAAAAPFARIKAQMGAEVLWGPIKAADESGGALVLLDQALAAADGAAAAPHMKQVVRALRLIDHELTLNLVDPRRALRALSDAAFELGLMLMEANAGVPDGGDAVLADVRGTLDAIENGAAAAREMTTAELKTSSATTAKELARHVAKVRQAVDAAKSSHDLTRRADLVVVSGQIGIATRRLSVVLGEKPELPYRARHPQAKNDPSSEAITPFVVPARRGDLREGDPSAMADLGRDLFRDKRLSAGARRACDDCHQADKALTDGRPTPLSLDPKTPITRNTPTLLYGALNAAQLWDGQFASAERQALKVIHAKTEMGLTSEQLVKVVSSIADHNAQFTLLFDDGVTASNIARALVEFQTRDFVPTNAPIDRFAQGDEDALTDEMHRGFDVFVGVGRCARCHVPPLFGGSRPTDFSTPIFAAVGVPRGPDQHELDPDRGRGGVTSRSVDEHAFKTPTVRNIALTAPYFHNGSFPTLESVVDFYVAGGGPSVGVSISNLDPEIRKLKLEDAQRAALLAFMRTALTDAP